MTDKELKQLRLNQQDNNVGKVNTTQQTKQMTDKEQKQYNSTHPTSSPR